MQLTQFISTHFIQIQWVVLIFGILYVIRILNSNSTRSQFRVREADRTDLNRLKGGPSLADAKLNVKKPPPPPLLLPGMRLDGEPHEILGVKVDASEAEVMKAYKDAIKRFHPDRIQGEAQSQLQFYQEASAKLNWAKEEMLRSLKK